MVMGGETKSRAPPLDSRIGAAHFLRFLPALLGHTELHNDLLTAGMITALNLVNGRVQNLERIHRKFPETCFDVLTKSLRVAPGFPWLVQALKAGFLVMEDVEKADHIPLSNLRTPTWLAFFRVVKEKVREICSTVLPKAKFRRCALCMSTYYCSAECQGADWVAG
ncbi:hypothetical protein B0H13DRAFT_1855335 [Mycena leptocephala]|nr:hypothetical protein B0H13DRAFT_1855335 [Mycena leptocephala]